MDDKKRNVLIIVLIALLILLVILGLIMIPKENKDKNTGKEKDKEKTNKLCVEKLCISRVSLEEIESSKSLYIELKNTGNTKIERECIKIKTKELEIPTCVENVEPNTSLKYVYEYNEQFGDKLEDFELIKNTEIE